MRFKMTWLGSFFTKFAAKVLAVDQTAVPEQQIAIIREMIAKQKVLLHGKKASELLQCLNRKHLVNSITVRRLKTGLVFSSSGNGSQESESASQVMRFVNKNLSGAGIVAVKANNEWLMLAPLHDSLYIVRANSPLSSVELKALANEIDAVFKEKRVS